MKKKTMLVIGILGILLTVGTMSAAMAQSTGSNKIKEAQSHECTPEMMENMSKNCPEQMMQSETYAGSSEIAGADHCEDMDSDKGSMMDSRVVIPKGIP